MTVQKNLTNAAQMLLTNNDTQDQFINVILCLYIEGISGVILIGKG